LHYRLSLGHSTNRTKAFGVGLQDKWPWPAVIIIGFGFVGVQVVAIPTISITYAIDCYRPISGEIMAIATVCKNTFGVSKPNFPSPIPFWHRCNVLTKLFVVWDDVLCE
jgi:hypothetical protein